MRSRYATLSLAALTFALAALTLHRNASAAASDGSSPILAVTPPMAPAKPATASDTYTAYGFRIQSLEAPISGVTTPVFAVVMQLPPDSGYRASVNVQLQAYNDSLQHYMETSKAEMNNLNMKIISEKTPTPNEWIFEYTGQIPMQINGQTVNKTCHFIAHVVLANKTIYHATGACIEETWALNSDKIVACVNSLQAPPIGK